MAIKINTAYGERLTSGMLNEKISNLVGGNEKLSGFDVSIASPTSVTIKPGKAIINGCAIEETSDTNTVVIDPRILSNDSIAYVVIDYSHENKRVVFSCVTQLTSSMVKLATLFIKSGVISELTNHNPLQTLNTVVGEAADIEAQKIRDSIPSGFVELGELDYDFMLNNENKVKLKTKSIAYVNGYRIEIPANTIINIGKAPEKSTREDLLFLEAWKDTDFSKNGKLKYRIRYISDFNFNFKGDKSVATPIHPYIGWLDDKQFTQAYAKGSNYNLLPPKSISGYELFRSPLGWKNSIKLNDSGLWIAGLGDDESKARFKTSDGYVYAIPMFRLYRKPSCGKSIPFEYNKINPKVDYSKFTALMKEEKVERVTNEVVKGNSLVNLLNIPLSYNERGNTKSSDGYITCVTSHPSDWSVIPTVSDVLKPSTVYTILVTDYNAQFERVEFGYNSLPFKDLILSRSNGLVKRFTTDSTITRGITFKAYGSSTEGKVKFILLEGDWTNKEIPEYFEGLKSLGEEEHNLIEVKTGVIDENTHDPCDGNVKLSTAPNVTHVMSDNTIIPTIEAEVKRGDTKLYDLTKFGKLETVGDETIELTKIKGRTLQNLWKCLKNTPNNSYTINKVSSDRLFSKHDTVYTLKEGTIYTVIFTLYNVTGDTSNKVSISFNGGRTSFAEGFVELKNGTYKCVRTLSNYADDNIKDLMFYIQKVGEKGDCSAELKDIMILEGDHTNTPIEELPFVEGIQSVGENEVQEDGKYLISGKSCGKNMFDVSTLTFGKKIDDNGNVATGIDTQAITNLIKVNPNTWYTYSIKNVSGVPNALNGSRVFLYDISGNFVRKFWLATGNDKFLTNSNVYFLRIAYSLSGGGADTTLDNVQTAQLEEGETATAYEPYQESTYSYILDEPLRQLPNGVADSIDLETGVLTRRVGKVVLDGREDWTKISWQTLDNTILFRLNSTEVKNESWGRITMISDRFIGLNPEDVWAIDVEGVGAGTAVGDGISIRILKSKLETEDVAGFKTWLQANPTTVYYELANPIEEEIEHYYDKESIKTYQLEEPLRALPNGVKDEIKDGVLIRRCGEITLTGTEDWRYDALNGNYFKAAILRTELPNAKESEEFVSNMFNKIATSNDALPIEEGICRPQGNIVISINKTRLTSADVSGLKAWIKQNPVKLIYELATPTETILTEVHSSATDFSLERQFGEGNYLRELPNGVKDTVENGKVIRRTKKLVLNGSENWTTSRFTEQSEFIGFELAGIGLKPGNRTNLVCDKFNVIETINQNNTCEGIQASSTNDLLWIKIYKTRLTEQTIQGFKTWLQSNPVTVLYELATPTEEELTNENCNYFPCHPFNTYCGSMYVGNGTNEVLVNSVIPKSEDIIINTPFRKISGRDKVNDCRYKKVADGYDTMYETGLGNNKLKLTPSNMEQGTSYDVDNITWEEAKNKASFVNTRVRMKDTFRVSPNTQYIINNTGNLRFVVKEFNVDGIGIKDVGWFDAPYKFTTTANTKFMVLMFMKRDGSAITPTEVLNANFMLNLGDSALPYEPFVSNENIFENTEENDIEDLRHQVSLTGFNYQELLDKSFDKLLRGEL